MSGRQRVLGPDPMAARGTTGVDRARARYIVVQSPACSKAAAAR